MIIQVILVGLIGGIMVYALYNRNGARLRAGKKLLLAGFVICSSASVVEPGILTMAARAVGVGRGADLLLYLLIVAFIFTTINTYLKFKDYEQKVVELARRIAIDEATAKPARVELAPPIAVARTGDGDERASDDPTSNPT